MVVEPTSRNKRNTFVWHHLHTNFLYTASLRYIKLIIFQYHFRSLKLLCCFLIPIHKNKVVGGLPHTIPWISITSRQGNTAPSVMQCWLLGWANTDYHLTVTSTTCLLFPWSSKNGQNYWLSLSVAYSKMWNDGGDGWSLCLSIWKENATKVNRFFQIHFHLFLWIPPSTLQRKTKMKLRR